LVVGIGESAIEPALLAGGIRCPDCEARLAPWGHAREREVRMRYGGPAAAAAAWPLRALRLYARAAACHRRAAPTRLHAGDRPGAVCRRWRKLVIGRSRPSWIACLAPSAAGCARSAVVPRRWPAAAGGGRSRSARSPRADGRPSRRWPMVSRRSAGPTRGMWRASAARRTSGSCSSRCAAAIYCTAAPAIRRTFLDALRRPVAPADRGSASTVDTSRLSGP